MSIHRLDTTLTIECIDDLGVEVDVDVRVDYEYTPATGDGWNEPREPARCDQIGMRVYDPAFGWRNADKLMELLLGLCGDRIQEKLMEDYQGHMESARDEAAEARRQEAAE